MTNSRPPTGNDANSHQRYGSSPYGFDNARQFESKPDQTAQWNGQGANSLSRDGDGRFSPEGPTSQGSNSDGDYGRWSRDQQTAQMPPAHEQWAGNSARQPGQPGQPARPGQNGPSYNDQWSHNQQWSSSNSQWSSTPSWQNGPQGPYTPQGAYGSQGPTNPQGSYGPQGPYGSQGPNSPQGPYGPQGPQGPGGSWSQLPNQSGGTKKINIVAFVALGLAVLGLILSVIPVTQIVGWVILGVAFICSLVALFLKNQPRVSALIALAVTVLSALIALVVAFVMANLSDVDETVDEQEQSSATETQDQDPQSSPIAPAPTVPLPTTPQQSGDPGQAGQQPGQMPTPGTASSPQTSRDNPAALGETLTVGQWDVAINSFNPDATEQIVNGNMFNTPPDDGTIYCLLNVTFTNKGTEKTLPFLAFAFIDEAGQTYYDYDNLVALEDSYYLLDLGPGQQGTGSVTIQIPAGASGVLQVTDVLGTSIAYVSTH